MHLWKLLAGTGDAYHGLLLRFEGLCRASHRLLLVSLALLSVDTAAPLLSAASCKTILPLATSAAPTLYALRHFFLL